jgi:hypothetical protein
MHANLSKPRPPKHGPQRILQYYEIHETVMESFRRSGFVGPDTVELIPIQKRLFVAGQIGCKGRIVIGVVKELEYIGAPYDPNPYVQTIMYAYNVSVHGVGNVFRYDNQHTYRGHQDEHHRHSFDWKTNNEHPGSPEWMGADRWPTLGEVIEEAMGWHAENYGELRDPEGFPEELRRGLRL